MSAQPDPRIDPGTAEHLRTWRLIEQCRKIRPLTDDEKRIRASTLYILKRRTLPRDVRL